MCDAKESSDMVYLIVPKEETLDDLVIHDHSEDDADAVIPKEELSDTCPRLDDEFNEQNVGMVMPIKTELILCDNIAQLRRQHESAEHGSVSDKDVFTGTKAAEINQEQHKDSSMHAACVATSDVPMLKKCTQSQWSRTADKQIFFFCKVCKKMFQCRSAIIIHMRSHTGEKPYLCVLCQKKYMHSSSLIDHMRTHTGEKPYSCDVCQKKFTRSGTLLLHMRTHTGEKPYCCKVCQKFFSRKGDLTKHMRIHTGEKPYSCDLCQRKFTQKYNVTKHMRTHTGEKPLSRDQYEIKYASKTPLIIKNLRTHNVDDYGSSAGKQKLFFCNVCKKQFKSRSSLIIHIGTHTGERPYVCDLCQNNFSQKSCLRRHMKIHAGEKAHSCDLCQKKFIQKCYLTKHMRTHTACENKNASRTPITKKNLRTHAEENFGSPNEKQKLFFCKISCVTCKKQFKCRSDLMIHMKVHTEEKPFSRELCQNKFTSSSGLLMHMGTHTSKKPYSIDLCENKYSSKNPSKMSNLKEESIKKNEKLKLFFCNVCKKQFKRRISLIIHMRTHTGERSYVCDLCQNNFLHKSCLRKHMKFHAGEKAHSCDLCQNVFIQKCNLTKHMRTHTACEKKNASRTPITKKNLRTHAEENFGSPNEKQKLFFCKISCVTCKKQFKSRSDLMIHMKVHTEEKPFSRELCQNKFTSSSGLIMHMGTHTSEKPYSIDLCENKYSSKNPLKMNNLKEESIKKNEKLKLFFCNVCKKQFQYRYSLIIHMRTHTGEKPYLCDLCQKNFSQKACLRRHMKIHAGEKAHSCDLCQKKFIQKCNLAKHMRTHTACENKNANRTPLIMNNLRTHADENFGSPDEKQKLFFCKISCVTCKKQFKYRSALMIHMKSHTGEKPFSCDLCQHTFTSSSGLLMHTRTHTGEKPYVCDLCQKNFSQKACLRRHMTVHMGEKAHSCDTCQKKFTQKYNLTKHISTHLGKKLYSCNLCERKFPSTNILLMHTHKTHAKEKFGFPAEKDKIFPCNVCNKQFVCKSALDIHMRTHIGEKPYFCDLCEEKFESSNLLFVHNLETHTEERFGSSAEKDKLFSCNFCEKQFIWRSALDTHVRTHTADKPYSCDLRENEIANTNLLIMHNLGTHVEEKGHSTAKQELFPCNICERQFIWRSALDNHMRTHTGEIIYSSGLCQI